jgi:hypothetical protein
VGGGILMKKIVCICCVYNIYKKFFISSIFFLTLTKVNDIITIEQGQNLGKLTKKQKELK